MPICFTQRPPWRQCSTIFYLSNEGISILENVGKLRGSLPQKVQTLLSYLKNQGTTIPILRERRRRHGAHSTPNLSHPNDCYRSSGAPHASGADAPLRGLWPSPMPWLLSKVGTNRGKSLCPRLHRRQHRGSLPDPPWTCCGWHGGGSSNNTHIGVEMCEPASIRYTSGANFLDQDPAATEAAVLRTYGTAVDLFAQLCRTFSLDPLGDGVILSSPRGPPAGHRHQPRGP